MPKEKKRKARRIATGREGTGNSLEHPIMGFVRN
jgi:hypothetical protein